MSLNIKNERVHAMARELAALKGTNMTAAIEEALELALRRTKTEDDRTERRRIEAHEELMALLRSAPKLPDTPGSDHSDLYDESGLPA